MANLNIGDKVRFLNAVGGGIVRRIEGEMAYVEEPDGFETPILSRECVVVEPALPRTSRKAVQETTFVAEEYQAKEADAAASSHADAEEETPEGERLNVSLAIIAQEIKHLTTTSYDVCLVNDSNYYLYFTYMSRDDEGWRTRYAGVIEPNMQMQIEELQQADVNGLQRIGFQYVAFKKGKHFAMKNPGGVDMRFDSTRLYKLHSFRQNAYFDEAALMIDLVKNDVRVRPLVVDAEEVARVMSEKRAAAVANKPHVSKPNRRQADIIEVDLHIGELLDSTAGLSNSDMLEVQMDTFRRVLAEHKNDKGQRIVFIHGKGEGVLRRAIIDELRTKYKQYTYQDASFREYGFGATMVTIH